MSDVQKKVFDIVANEAKLDRDSLSLDIHHFSNS